MWATFRTKSPGPLLHTLIDITITFLCIRACRQAAHRSQGLARQFWRLSALCFSIFGGCLLCYAYLDVAPAPPPFLGKITDMLSVFWYGPTSLILFLNADFEPRKFDRIHILDFCQVFLFWGAIYFYFQYLPGHDPSRPVIFNWLRSTWAGSLVYDVSMALAFTLRAVLTNSAVIRTLFGRMAAYLSLACLADFGSSYLFTDLQPGSWYDFVWTWLDVLALVLAATWNKPRERVIAPQSSRSLIENRLSHCCTPSLYC